MRPLLCHEKKIVELMLSAIPECEYTFPKKTLKVLFGRDAAFNAPFVLNETFTLYFCEDTDEQELNLVYSDLGMPKTIGNEVFLVKDASTSQLAFLEYMGPTLPDYSLFVPYLRAIVASMHSAKFEKRSMSLVNQLVANFTPRCNDRIEEPQILTHARLLIFGSVVCFYLSTSESLLLHQPEETIIQEFDSGLVQELLFKEDLALEGWLESRP